MNWIHLLSVLMLLLTVFSSPVFAGLLGGDNYFIIKRDSNSLDFNKLYNFPSPCAAGYAIQAIDNNVFTCIAVSAGSGTDTNNVTAGWQTSNGDWAIDINASANSVKGKYFKASNGTVLLPFTSLLSYTFFDDLDTGFYRSASGAMTFIGDLGNIITLSPSVISFSTNLVADTTLGAHIKRVAGTAALPTFTFKDNNNTGMWRSDVNTIGFSTGGVNRVNIKSNGDVNVLDGNVHAKYFLGDGSLLTGISSGGVDTNWQTSWVTFDTNMKSYYPLKTDVNNWIDARERDTNWQTSYNLLDANLKAIYQTGTERDTNWKSEWSLFDTNMIGTYRKYTVDLNTTGNIIADKNLTAKGRYICNDVNCYTLNDLNTRGSGVTDHSLLSNLEWSVANHSVDVDFVPQDEATQSLGNGTNTWKDLFIGNNAYLANIYNLAGDAHSKIIWNDVPAGILYDSWIASSTIKTERYLGVKETGSLPTYYTYFMGGDQTSTLYYTLPNAFPVTSGIMKSDYGGGMSWDESTYLTAPADPGGNRIFGWDDTDNNLAYFLLGNNLTYTPATNTLSAQSGYQDLNEFIDQNNWSLYYTNADGNYVPLEFDINGKYLRSTGVASAPIWDTTPSTATAGGSDRQVQFNSATALAGDSSFYFGADKNLYVNGLMTRYDVNVGENLLFKNGTPEINLPNLGGGEALLIDGAVKIDPDDAGFGGDSLQTTTFLVNGPYGQTFDNSAQFNNRDGDARVGFILSNSGDDTDDTTPNALWYNNFLQMGAHGTRYVGDYYFGDSTDEGGLAGIWAQGGYVTELAIFGYNNIPVTLGTNNTRKLTISTDGTIDVTGDIDLTGGIIATGDIYADDLNAKGNSVATAVVTGWGGYGFADGTGGSVTQATSKSTAVTINTIWGNITTHNASLAAATQANFTVHNSLVDVNDFIIVSTQSSIGNRYLINAYYISPGDFNISVRNLTASAFSDAIPIKYMIVKMNN